MFHVLGALSFSLSLSLSVCQCVTPRGMQHIFEKSVLRNFVQFLWSLVRIDPRPTAAACLILLPHYNNKTGLKKQPTHTHTQTRLQEPAPLLPFFYPVEGGGLQPLTDFRLVYIFSKQKLKNKHETVRYVFLKLSARSRHDSTTPNPLGLQ